MFNRISIHYGLLNIQIWLICIWLRIIWNVFIFCLVYLFNGISTPKGLFNAENWCICICLLRCNINAGVRARRHGWSGRVTQRCHNSLGWETGLASANDVPHQKRAEDLGNMKKVNRVETKHRTRGLTFACSRWTWAGVAWKGVGGRGKGQNRKIVHLSPYVEKPLKSKVIKNWCICICLIIKTIIYRFFIYLMVYQLLKGYLILKSNSLINVSS